MHERSKPGVQRADLRRYYRGLPRRVRRSLRLEATAGWIGIVRLALPLPIWICVVLAGVALGLRHGDLGVLIGALLGLAVGLGAAFIMIDLIDALAVRAYLHRHVIDGRVTKCPRCGYDLRGTISQTCQECGLPVVVGPGSDHARLIDMRQK